MSRCSKEYWDVWNNNHPEDKIKKGDGFVIHHINENHEDNRIENLQKMKFGDHSRLHHSGENCNFFGEDHTGTNNPMYGKKHSEETKRKMLEKRTYHHGKDHAWYGKEHTQETKDKISKANSGIKRTDEVKKNISEKTTGANNPMFGKTQSEETKKKISAAHTGRKHSEKSKQNMREAQLKRWAKVRDEKLQKQDK